MMKKEKNCLKMGLIYLAKFGGGGLTPTPTLTFSYWKTWLTLVMLEHVQACFPKDDTDGRKTYIACCCWQMAFKQR